MSGLFGWKKYLALFTSSAAPVLGLKGGCGKSGGVDQIGIRDGVPAEADLLRSRGMLMWKGRRCQGPSPLVTVV